MLYLKKNLKRVRMKLLIQYFYTKTFTQAHIKKKIKQKKHIKVKRIAISLCSESKIDIVLGN